MSKAPLRGCDTPAADATWPARRWQPRRDAADTRGAASRRLLAVAGFRGGGLPELERVQLRAVAGLARLVSRATGEEGHRLLAVDRKQHRRAHGAGDELGRRPEQL